MNKIGIIFAIKEELEAALSNFELVDEYKIFDLTFYDCKLQEKECVLVECGIGKVNAARCSQILIELLDILNSED